MLDARDIEIVQRDWEKLEGIAAVAGDLFYRRLFELDPSVRPLFEGDMAEQKLKLMRMIGSAVYGLTQPEVFLPIVEHLGRKHAVFGVKEEHYATVGSALLWTLQAGLGDAFGPDNAAAWSRVYDLLATTMKAAA